MNVVIQHVPGERSETITAILRAVPNALVVECDGRPMETFHRCLIDMAHWHMEDDIVLAPDFAERATDLVRRLGSGVIRGFCTGHHRAWMPASSYLYNQCTWLPDGAGSAISAFARQWPKLDAHPTGFDLVIRDWMVANRMRYWLESPSLVQHHRGRSLLGPRSRFRTSKTFDDTYGTS